MLQNINWKLSYFLWSNDQFYVFYLNNNIEFYYYYCYCKLAKVVQTNHWHISYINLQYNILGYF